MQFPGALYHVYTRGNGKQSMFLSPRDRDCFLELVYAAVSDYSWVCHSYCLMDNHYHLLLETPESNLASGMQFLNGSYGGWFNRRHDRIGHVTQGRYHSPLVTDDSHYLELLRYMALNPVAAGFAQHPREWRWSSYRAMAGLAPAPPFLTEELALGMFSKTLAMARKQYVAFVLERLQEALESGKGRPALSDILMPDMHKDERGHAIAIAHMKHGYSPAEIAKYLNINRSTVSRIISRCTTTSTNNHMRWE